MTYEEIKEKFYEKKNYIVVALGFVLVFLLGFGTGIFEKDRRKNGASLPNYTTNNEKTVEKAKVETKTVTETPKIGESKVLGQATSSTPAQECVIKGNISTNSKIYHVRGGAFYERTNAEMCFKTEEEAYRNFLNHPLVYIDRVDNWSYRENFIAFINTLRNADIIISTYSTISVEAVVFDRPLININFDGYHNRLPDESVKRLEYFSHFIHVSGTGALSNVNSEAELKSALSLYLASPDTLHREREALQRKMCFRLDGKSSLRIVEAVLDYLYA